MKPQTCDTALLDISGLSKSYQTGRRVLNDIRFALAASEYVAIMGESGSGKSTLLNLIAGLDLPDAGVIRLDGVDLTRLDDTQRTLLRRSHLGFVFQAFHLLPHLTVLQNVRLPLDLAGTPRREADARANALLDDVGLPHLAARYPRALSGGEMQRAAIARALIHRPRLLLADEPTGNLDAESAAAVLQLLRQHVKAHAGAGILVTHSTAAAATTDRTYRLTAAGLQPQ